jgi:hypothetical protein
MNLIKRFEGHLNIVSSISTFNSKIMLSGSISSGNFRNLAIWNLGKT